MRSRVQDEESARKSGQHGIANISRTVEDEWNDMTPYRQRNRKRWEGREYAIVPHTDENGEQYAIGDCYNGIVCADEWRVDRPGLYLEHIKNSSLPQDVKYLGHWLEVTTSPAKWHWMRHFPENRAERASRTKACVIDYCAERLSTATHCNDVSSLSKAIESPLSGKEDHQIRLLVVEDLSRDVIEVLGSHYKIPPQFFRGHIDDYMFFNTRDPWVYTPRLTRVQQQHLSFKYLRARYYETEEEFEAAEVTSGLWNILRRIDSDRSRRRLQDGLLDRLGASVALLRSKLSLWTRSCDGEGFTIAVLLVDPTPGGHPLWGGPVPNEGFDSKLDVARHSTGSSLFDHIVEVQCTIPSSDLAIGAKQHKYLILPALRHMVADWLLAIGYMITQTGKLQWEFERPHMGATDLDVMASSIRPWTRNVDYYEEMLEDLNENVLEHPSDLAIEVQPLAVKALRKDVQKAQRRLRMVRQRLEAMQGFLMDPTRTAEEEAKKRDRRITLFATVFLPLNLVTSFLSMSDHFSVQNNTFWLFFAILGVLIVLYLVVWPAYKRVRIWRRRRLW